MVGAARRDTDARFPSVRSLVVIPTHNEVDNVGAVLDSVEEHAPDADIVVVDDASTDGTRELVRGRPNFGAGLRMFERPVKSGLGRAYLDAFDDARQRGYQAVAQLDADGSHDPVHLPLMFELAARGIDVVIGSRYIPGGTVLGWPRRRTWLSRWGNRYSAVVLGLAINDATAGYRVYRTEALDRMGLESIDSDGYVFQVEMTQHAVQAGCSVVEVPIEFRDRTAGVSKMSKGIVGEAFLRVSWWGLQDAISLRRRNRAYRGSENGSGG